MFFLRRNFLCLFLGLSGFVLFLDRVFPLRPPGLFLFLLWTGLSPAACLHWHGVTESCGYVTSCMYLWVLDSST